VKYDWYNRANLWKPGKLATRCRNRLHRGVLAGLELRRVLEIGVGLGEFARWCRDQRIDYIGVEPNPRLREALAAEGFTVVPGQAPDLPDLPPGPLDAIFAAHLIEHLPGCDAALQFVQRAGALLAARGGRWLVLLYPDIERCKEFFWQDYTHSFVTTLKRVNDLVCDAGFRVARSGRYTACLFHGSWLLAQLRHFVPYFLLPPRVAWFARLSFQQHSFTVAEWSPL